VTTSEQDRVDLRRIAELAESGDYRTLQMLAAMNADNLEVSGLDMRTHTLVRLAALAAVGGSPLTWAMHTDATTPDQMLGPDLIGTIIAIAPIIGSARAMSAISEFVHAMTLGDGMAEAFGE
jgi:4-carboxymuconolactone decarboxylase